jgi:hypothetical protein
MAFNFSVQRLKNWVLAILILAYFAFSVLLLELTFSGSSTLVE